MSRQMGECLAVKGFSVGSCLCNFASSLQKTVFISICSLASRQCLQLLTETRTLLPRKLSHY